MKNQDVFKKIEDSIDSLEINETEKKALLEGVLRIKKQKIKNFNIKFQ